MKLYGLILNWLVNRRSVVIGSNSGLWLVKTGQVTGLNQSETRITSLLPYLPPIVWLSPILYRHRPLKLMGVVLPYSLQVCIRPPWLKSVQFAKIRRSWHVWIGVHWTHPMLQSSATCERANSAEKAPPWHGQVSVRISLTKFWIHMVKRNLLTICHCFVNGSKTKALFESIETIDKKSSYVWLTNSNKQHWVLNQTITYATLDCIDVTQKNK